MVFKTHDPITMNDQVHNPLRKALMGLEYLLLRRGPLTMGASQVCVFARSTPEAATPDLQFHLQPLSADKPGAGLHRYSAFTRSEERRVGKEGGRTGRSRWAPCR